MITAVESFRGARGCAWVDVAKMAMRTSPEKKAFLVSMAHMIDFFLVNDKTIVPQNALRNKTLLAHNVPA